MVKVWKWSERVIELSGDPNYRLAIMQMLLQRDHSASAAPELWLRLERRHKKPSLSLLFLIIFPTTGLEYLLHTEALCVSPSAEAMRAKARIFFCLLEVFQLNFAFMQMPFFPIYSLSLLAASPAPLNVSNRCSLTWQHQGPATQLRSWSSHVPSLRLLRSPEEVRVLSARVVSERGPLVSSECLASSLIHKGACRLGQKSRKLTKSSLNSGMMC